MCVIPYVYTSMTPEGKYRDCCATTPNTRKFESDFVNWWHGDEMKQLRQDLSGTELPNQCCKCKTEEALTGYSYRLINSKDAPDVDVTEVKLPSRFQVGFGNLCNLACWTCGEWFSSKVLDDKVKTGLISPGWAGNNLKFQEHWPSLKQAMLESYEQHETVHINVFGGEPTINHEFENFLSELNDRNLTERTQLEFFTNCHLLRDSFLRVLTTKQWKCLTVLASIDAYGKKNDWVRYGSAWESVDRNLRKLQSVADYTKILSVQSVLTVNDLQALKEYAASLNLTVGVQYATEPWFMDIQSWDGANFAQEFTDAEAQAMVSKLGAAPVPGAKAALRDYITKLSAVRELSLAEIDPDLYRAIYSE